MELGWNFATCNFDWFRCSRNDRRFKSPETFARQKGELVIAHLKPNLPEKPCLACGRPFKWRKKWAKVWDEVKYCSQRCKSQSRKKNKNEN
jgi:hypothetical protein